MSMVWGCEKPTDHISSKIKQDPNSASEHPVVLMTQGLKKGLQYGF